MSLLEFHQEIKDHAEQHDGDDDEPDDVLSECKKYALATARMMGIREENEKTESRSEAKFPDQGAWATETQLPAGPIVVSPASVPVVVETALAVDDPGSARRVSPSQSLPGGCRIFL